jgi:hypothetical protein
VRVHKLYLLAVLLPACGEVPLVAAHTSISAGCITAATYAAEHQAVTPEDLDGFELSCNQQLDTLERWSALEQDGGANDAR